MKVIHININIIYIYIYINMNDEILLNEIKSIIYIHLKEAYKKAILLEDNISTYDYIKQIDNKLIHKQQQYLPSINKSKYNKIVIRKRYDIKINNISLNISNKSNKKIVIL